MSEITEPHPASEGWTIEVTPMEMMRVLTFARSRLPHVDDSVVWVKHNGVASRRWLIGGDRFWMWVDSTGGSADPVEVVAIPVPFLGAVCELAQAFGTATIYRDATDGRFAAYSADEHLWWDSIENHPDTWYFDEEVSFDDPVSAKVDFAALERMVSTYVINRGGLHLGESGTIPPYVTLGVGGGRLRWTTSYARFNQPDVSGSTVAETDGEGMIAFCPLDMFRVVHVVPTVGEVTVSWESSDAGEVCLHDEDWGIVCEVTDEVLHQVYDEVFAAFAENEWIEVEPFGLRHGVLTFRNSEERVVVVTVVEGVDNARDYVRMSTRVATVEGDPGAVLENLNALNGKLVGAKVIRDGDGVYVSVEFSTPAPKGYIGIKIKDLFRHAAKCEGLDQFLPLFSLPTAD